MANTIDDLTLEEIADKDIIELIGAESLSEPDKAALYEKMLETIRIRTMVHFDELLNDQERAEFKQILESNNQPGIEAFMAMKNFDVDNEMAEEAIKYKIELVAHVKTLNLASQTMAENNANAGTENADAKPNTDSTNNQMGQ